MKKRSLISMLLSLSMLMSGATVMATETENMALNVLSANDAITKGWYADNGYTLTYENTGADYMWTYDYGSSATISDEQDVFGTTIVTNETASSYQRPDMQDGGIGGGGRSEVNTEYGKTKLSITWDLKDICTVDRVDIVGASGNPLRQVEIYGKVEASDEWTKIGEVLDGTMTSVAWDSTSNKNLYSFNLTSGSYRYVRIDMWASNSQANLSEMYIFGETVENITVMPEGNIYFTDLDHNRIYRYAGENTIIAKAEVKNSDAYFITAWYDIDGRLKDAFLDNGTFSTVDEVYTIEYEVLLDGWEDGDYLKGFLFESLENIKPITLPETLIEVDETETALISGNDVGDDVLSYPVSEGYDLVTTGKYATAAVVKENEDKLFDGNKESTITVDGSDSEYVSVNIHFDTMMELSKVNIYANCAENSYMSDYEIYSSIDGISYEHVATRENTVTKSLNRILNVSTSLTDVVYTKHVRIVMHKDTTVSDMQLAEVELYGKFPRFPQEIENSYIYENEVPFKTAQDIIDSDSSRNILTDGNKTEGIESSGDYVSVIYSLDDYKQIEEANIYGKHSGCELLTSLDGVSYTTIGFFPATEGFTKVYGKSYDNAKFAKLVFRKGDLDKIKLNEIELYTRNLYEFNGDINTVAEKVTVKPYLKPNNILYLDWSGYNHKENGVLSYKVFIEENTFTSTNNKEQKMVYCNGNDTPINFVETQSCLYAGLEPDKDYYVAVQPITSNQTDGNVTPIKIHTYSALGGEKLSGIFCMNEYPNGGGAHVEHEDENANLQTKLKLIDDMEVLSKTRYWYNYESVFKKYISRGFSFHQYVKPDQTELLNSYGIYSFASINEPDLNDTYKDDPQGYINKVISSHDEIKGANDKNVLCEASVCGTDKLDWVEKLYQTDSNYGSYYDVFDVHAYCKGFEGKDNLDDNISSTSEAYGVPEHLFGKVDKIRDLLEKYNDDKDIIFTEIGWSTHSIPYIFESVNEKVTKEEQANFVARTYLISAALGIKNVFLYAFQDEGTSTTNKEEQFGIVDWYGMPKPAYYTYYTLGKLFREAEFVEMVDGISHPNYAMTFYDNEKNMYMTAMWNISGNGDTVTINSSDNELMKIDAYGNVEYINNGDIEIQSAPIYIYSSDVLNVTAK